MSKLEKSVSLKMLIMLIIIILLLLISLIMNLKETLGEKKNNQQYAENNINVIREQTEQEIKIPKTDEEIVKYLSTLAERDRMEYYCGIYFKHIKHNEFDKAYELLDTEFKNNYFPTLEDYEKYVQEFYPDFFGLEYDDITRQGTLYVLRLNIVDATGGKTNEENIQRIVIKENYYNDFVLSFQVK